MTQLSRDHQLDGPLLDVRSLSVRFGSNRVVDDVSFRVAPGQTLAIVGESGSGKSVTSLAIMRLIDHMNGTIDQGEIRFGQGPDPVDIARASQDEMRRIRGKDVAMIFQEPMTSLNPVFTVGDQIAEVLMLHEGLSKSRALTAARELLEMVRLPDAAAMLKRYPHQLSGGMRQRVMIAMALACRPKLLIADEPTTALDVTIQAQILSIIRDLQKKLGMAVIFITHDMGVVAEIADRVVVMWRGRKVEEGQVEEIFARPAHAYTRALLSAVPALGSMTGEPFPKRLPLTVMDGEQSRVVGVESIQDTARYDQAPILSLRGLEARFDVRRNLLGRVTHRVHAVEGVDLDLWPGETLSLVGESGSGKSTIGRTIQQLQDPTGGEVRFEGRPMAEMSAGERRKLRRQVQYVFQDPFASLDPRRTVGFSIAEPITTHGLIGGAKAIRSRVAELLERVGLKPDFADRYPHEFSGGQRQRICIARALASKPRLIIADEALSALDVSVQAQIINLMMELQAEEGLAYLFISHDMAVVEKISHRVAVLYLGQIVEIGSRAAVFERPMHPYTRKLLSAVPVADPTRRPDRPMLDGEIPSPVRRVGDAPRILSLKSVAPDHKVAETA
jgi:glutathione transport system ATP-binding protein